MAAYRVLMSTIIPAFILALLSKGRLPEDKKEAAKDLFSYMIVPWYIIGNMASSIINGYKPRPGIGFDVFDNAGKLFTSEGWDTKGKYAAKVFAQTQGLPYNQPERTIKGIIDYKNGDTNDWRRFVWSQYALEGKDEGGRAKPFKRLSRRRRTARR
jgi:hypothetical protein